MCVALWMHVIVNLLELVFCSIYLSSPCIVLCSFVGWKHWQLIVFKQELNIGSSIVVAALTEACGTNKSKVQELYKSRGDLGTKKPYASLGKKKESYFIISLMTKIC